jgi:ABC-2 type transport system ATP-binding protein
MGAAVNAIETEQLTKRFRRVKSYRDLVLYRWRRDSDVAVQDVTLQIPRGELFGLLGENGAGKTTLIRMLSTTLLPTSGHAFVGGHDVVREPRLVRERIGLVNGDERSFYWRLTGRQNLQFFAALYHVPRHAIAGRIAQLLDTLGVTSYADRRFDSYSTGIRQKFAIARGMLTEPEVLFLDEPTRALDPIAADEVRRYVVEHIVGQLGYTVLLATHTLAEAEAICSRLAIIRHGTIVMNGTMEELRARTALAPVLDLVVSGQDAGLRDRICAVPGVTDVLIARHGEQANVSVTVGTEGDSTSGVLRAVLGAGLRVDACATRQPTLDDIYRAAHAQR